MSDKKELENVDTDDIFKNLSLDDDVSEEEKLAMWGSEEQVNKKNSDNPSAKEKDSIDKKAESDMSLEVEDNETADSKEDVFDEITLNLEQSLKDDLQDLENKSEDILLKETNIKLEKEDDNKKSEKEDDNKKSEREDDDEKLENEENDEKSEAGGDSDMKSDVEQEKNDTERRQNKATSSDVVKALGLKSDNFDEEDEEDDEDEDDTDNEEEKKDSIWSYLLIVACAFVIALFVNRFILCNAEIPSGSMEPTVMTGDRVFGNRLAYVFGEEPKRGDIIIFEYPDNPKKKYIKRIIGEPGDTIYIEDDCLYINDEIYDESDYLDVVPEGIYGPYEVPEDSYFVLGDNRNDSNDSRKWTNTFVTKDAIIAKAVIRYYPSFQKIK